MLARLVAPTPGNRSLGEVLAELSRQSGLSFSYSSSLIPVGHRYQLPVSPARPLGVVLREVLDATHLSYGLLDGQLVLWPTHAALPAGVTVVNGQPARSGPPLPARAAAAGTSLGTGASTPTSPRLTPNTAGPASVAAGTPTGRRGPAATLAATSISHQRASSASAQPAGHYSTTQASSQAAAASRRAARPLAAGPALPVHASKSSRGDDTGNKSQYLAKSTSPGPADQRASTRQRVSTGAARSLTLLTPHVILLLDSTLTGNSLPAVHFLGSRSFAAATPALKVASPPAAPGKRLDLATVWRHTYVHGEAWLSESLPVGGTAKVGVQRAYLVLNAAIGPLDRRSGVAWGLGLGTAGRARGRFTPSVDLVAWALPKDGDDDDIRHARLVQLRPLLAWQLKRDGQVSLLLGPTLNLATATQTSLRRWSFGQDQQLWLNKTDDQTVLRLWPGVQVGVRF